MSNERLRNAMTLDRGTLGKIDRSILSQLDHDEGVQLVKVPVSDAVWSTWRRYCDAVGIPMGRGLAILLHHQLASLVDEDLDQVVDLLGNRARGLNEREAALEERERQFEEREMGVASMGHRIAGVEAGPKPSSVRVAPAKVVPKVGRNDLCPCRSGLKYKRCHGA